MEFRILGPVEVHCETGPVNLSGSKIHTMLSTLLLAQGRSVSYEQLSQRLWGWSPPSTMSAQIYTYIHKLRKHLGKDVELVRSHGGYQLDIGESVLDVEAFRDLALRGERALSSGDYLTAADTLRSALTLWRGTPLTNVTDYLAELERPALEEAFVNVTEQRITAELRLGHHTRLIPELTGLVNCHPLREPFRAQLVTALMHSNRQADALFVYHEGRELLAEQLGVDPGPELARAYQAALNSETGPGGGAPVTLTRSAASPRPMMIPPETVPFSGRESELSAVEETLAAERDQGPGRLLLTGPPGSGKSALAVRAAHRCADRFPDGVLVAQTVDSDGDPYSAREVLSRLLNGMGHQVEPFMNLSDLLGRYRENTEKHRLLVVLDNVIGEQDIEPFVPAGPGSMVVVISRENLQMARNWERVALGPLPSSDGVKLLAAMGGEETVMKDLPAARAVVELCDGSPRALRIAGAKLADRPLWTIRDLARRLRVPALSSWSGQKGRIEVLYEASHRVSH